MKLKSKNPINIEIGQEIPPFKVKIEKKYTESIID